MSLTIEGYCSRCRRQRPINKPRSIKLIFNREKGEESAIGGQCSECGSGIYLSDPHQMLARKIGDDNG